jgi:hypothetical protein
VKTGKKRKRRVRKLPEKGRGTKVWWFFLLKNLLQGPIYKARQSKARPNA